MQFLDDMGGSIQIFDWLLGRWYDAVPMRNAEMHTAPDDQIFAKALASGAVMVVEESRHRIRVFCE